MRRILSSAIQSIFWLSMFAAPAAAINLRPIGNYPTGIFDDAAAVTPTYNYDPTNPLLFVNNKSANTIDILNISNLNNPELSQAIDIGTLGNFGIVNSVAYNKNNNILAAVVENTISTDLGNVLFFNQNGNFLRSLTVGALPDALTFTADGSKLLVANEGEPNSYNQPDSVDPEGSVSIIDLSGGVNNLTQDNVTTVNFDGISLINDVRIFGPNATVAQDLEPEYITVSGDKAYVTLQENNAIAILDLDTNKFEKVVGLGYKEHSVNPLDPSNEDGGININTYANLLGMYQPDEITSYKVDGKTYLVTANEGDARDYDGFSEEERVKDLDLDPDAFPNNEEDEAKLGRLRVTNTQGFTIDANGDKVYNQLYAFGGRSFSIWDENGKLVWDSGDDFEQITAKLFPDFFNSNNDKNKFDDRSDDKGPEPEGITLGRVGNKTYAFIGLERIGGVMIYDISNPQEPKFINYINNRDFSGVPEEGTAGDLGPEGLLYIAAENSPNKNPLLVVANDVSGTTTIYSIQHVPEPSSWLSMLCFTILSWLGFKPKKIST